jgi:hypothetical protein
MRTHALLGTTWLSLVGCYSPELRDCTVTCTAPDECADDQICAAGLCRSPDTTCGAGSGTSTPPPKVALRVDVNGEGMVVVDGIGTCASEEHDACTWMISVGVQVRLDARSLDDGEFERWTTENCANQDASCVLTATTATSVGAKFE